MKDLLLAFSMGSWTSGVVAAGKIHMHISPRGGCTEAVVEQLDHARSDVFVQAYPFTCTPIAKSLVEAFRRGVKVAVITR
jgi:phosphatidylserine/phosphatidylglycerophosphate/cardiolipin synthase-like enzyme